MHRSPAASARRQALHEFASGRSAATEADALADPRRSHLHALALAIEKSSDFQASILQPPVSSSVLLHVVNPRAARLAEDITCDFRDHTWSFVWSWGDVITAAGDLQDAVTSIRHVLTPAGDQP